ncbi:hypothetical protein [Paucibacter sp. KBW04]|uniref:hypothetical protein n=1 Tax=Paucibacter sp. KBW04 TaxID=2153361 RepID=UPI000F560F80|nr:hypothetical protein [Paucibacter sp. KBW04]
MESESLFDAVLDGALREIAAKQLPVYTFALYHDHESEAVSVCVDTEENSAKAASAINRYNRGYFSQAVANGDLMSARLWQANIGRSLSLGDFALVNVARTPLPAGAFSPDFYLSMVRSVMSVERRVAMLSPHPERLLFACSGPDAEVSYVWSALSYG